MSFIRFTNAEGATQAVNIDRINSTTYRRAEGDLQKSRIAIEIAGEETAVFVHGDEAARVWAVIEKLLAE